MRNLVTGEIGCDIQGEASLVTFSAFKHLGELIVVWPYIINLWHLNCGSIKKLIAYVNEENIVHKDCPISVRLPILHIISR